MKILLFAAIFSIMALNGVAQQQTQHNANDHMNQQSFEELVKSFERPDREWWQKPGEVITMMRPLKNKKILDLGCGTGYFSLRMIDSGATVIAADIDDRFIGYVDSVRKARGISEKKLITRKVAADNPGLDKREVDVVLIVNTFHHLENRVAYFQKLKTGLRSNGFVMVVDFFKKQVPVGPPVEMKQSADDVIRDLKMAGFSLFKTDETTLPYQYIVFAL